MNCPFKYKSDFSESTGLTVRFEIHMIRYFVFHSVDFIALVIYRGFVASYMVLLVIFQISALLSVCLNDAVRSESEE